MATNDTLITIIWEETESITPSDVKNGIERDGTMRRYRLPEPTSYSATTSAMVDSGTSVSGQLLGSMVRSDVAKISISWNYIDAPTWSKINQLFKDDYYKLVRFYDQTAGDWDQRKMSVSDRSAGMWRRNPDTGEVLGWTGCSLQFTEV
jgi:hypothetical protein